MAMTFEAVVGGTTYNLNDKAPFSFVGIENVGPAEVNRFGQRNFAQGGAVDLGYRLQPREIVLTLNFYAATTALLDTYRQSLFAIFRPTQDDPILLRITRDDATVRTLSCYTTGKVDISLLPEHYASRLHQATVRLRAAFPAWKAASSTSASLSGSANDWWLAGGLIGTANVMEHVEWPTQAQAWAWAGTATGNWSVVFRSAQEENTMRHTAFRAGTADNVNDPKVWRWSVSSWSLDTSNTSVSDLPSGTNNYIYTYEELGGTYYRTVYYGGTTLLLSTSSGTDVSLVGTAGVWRGDKTGAGTVLWTQGFPKAAIYNTLLSESQRIALDAHMAGTAILGTISAVNSGDLPIYPFITLQGPIINPILTNVTTGQVIDLVGLTLGSAEAVYVDLTGGNKTVTNLSGSSQLSTMGTPAQLANWYLAPAPIATGGTNSIRVQGGSITTGTRVEFVYHNQYMSY